jgi:hypothetical protein
LSSSDPQRELSTDAAAPRQSEERPAKDPWGIRRAENLLTSLQGVLSARVEVSPVGEVTGVHILGQAGMSPKQMVRNVESALLAQMGLKVDHRKISIAQTAEVRPIEALERAAVQEQAIRRDVVFRGLEVEPTVSLRVRVRVTLAVRGQEVSGEEEVADTERSRVQGAARATVAVLDRSLPDGTIELEGIRVMDAFEADLMVAGVRAIDGRTTQLLSGSAVVADRGEQAAVLAVLDATNRWLQTRGDAASA